MGYMVRLFNSDTDKEGLLRLWSESVRNPSAVRYEAMYADSAFRWITTWLLFHDRHADPVGCLSLMSRKFNVSGQDTLCGINCDIVVTRRHRTLGPAVILLESLIKECKDYGFKALLAMPNNMSRPIFIRAGYKEFGAVCRWSKVIRTEEKLKTKIKNVFLRKITAGLFDFFLRWVFGGIPQWFYGCLSDKLKAVNAPLDQLTINFDNDGTCAPECSCAYLKWRFARVGGDASQAYSLYRGDALLGLVIYSFKEQEVIIEYMFVSPNENINVLLAGFIYKMRQLRAQVISIAYFSSGKLRRNFQQMGFLQRASRAVFIYTIDKGLDGAFSGLLKEWSLFESDLDL